jgi:hypothetical protein
VRDVCYAGGGADQDGDGFSITDGDCNDLDPISYPGAPDVCDGADNSCSGGADDDLCDRYEVSGDTRVDGHELAWLGRAFGACSADPPSQWWFTVDYTLDGCVDGDDLAVMAAAWACSGAAPICN